MVFEIQYFDSTTKERFDVPGKKCLIGRSKNADLQIDRDGMSRKHLEVEWDGKEFYVTDLNSTNGVYVNSERIPPGSRTVYKNFLPLEIADKITIFVYSDEQIAADEFKKDVDTAATESSYAMGSSSKTSAASTNTRTMRLDRPTSSKKLSEAKTQKKSSSPLLPILIVVIGAGAYYYFSQEEKTATTPVTEVGATQATSKKTNNKFSIDEDTLGDYLRGPRCEGVIESGLCKKLGTQLEKEGILFKDSQLIITVNTDNFFKNNKSVIFARFKPNEKLEYLLANYATYPWMVEEAIKSQLKSIVVVGFKFIESKAEVTAALTFDPTKAPQAKEKDHRILFNNIYNAGIYRPYKIFYKPGVQFKNFSTEEKTPEPETSPSPESK